jgi:hypothetical protein
MIVLIHPTPFEEIILILMALQLIHFLKIIFENGDERIDSYSLKILQLLNYFGLLADLNANGAKQKAHILIAKCSFIDAK